LPALSSLKCVSDVVGVVFAIGGLLVIGLGMRAMWRGDISRNKPRPRVSPDRYHPGGSTPMARGDIGDGGDRRDRDAG
jgi:hypothetical protein